ncbi:hypothetical protein BC833DRAFT_586307 [Globomyces pollinis-pini]|nr:hypothetical protein BC833DRAFT_586307 [Globomyces pollinis-pini]
MTDKLPENKDDLYFPYPPQEFPSQEQFNAPSMDSFASAMARAHLAITNGQFPNMYSNEHFYDNIQNQHTRFDTPPEHNDVLRDDQNSMQNIKHQQQQEGKHNCHLCDRSFARVYNLKSHIKTHANQRPFECPECHQRFARNHDLNRHIKTHSQVRPHVCEICGRSFARRDALKRHERMNPEGKKIHCIPDPQRSFSARMDPNLVLQNELQANMQSIAMEHVQQQAQAALQLQRHLEEMAVRMNQNELHGHFDAASVISSLALRENEYITPEQALAAVHAMSQQQQQQQSQD